MQKIKETEDQPLLRSNYRRLSALAIIDIAVTLPALLALLIATRALVAPLYIPVIAVVLVLNLLTGYRLYTTKRDQRRFYESARKASDQVFRSFATQEQFDRYWLSLLEETQKANADDAHYMLLQKQAELGVMQNQINPHFLYNTLECLRGLAIEQGAYETANMAELLSRLYRYYISSGNDMETIENEFLCVDRYLRIQQYRFNNRFTLVRNIDESNQAIMKYKIPKLTLQPIIENIIRHAFNTKLNGNRITISIETTQSRLILSIADNGDGMDEASLKKLNRQFTSAGIEKAREEGGKGVSGTGIALSNINTRIQMIYGSQYGLTAFSSLGLGTEIRIEFPFEEEQHE